MSVYIINNMTIHDRAEYDAIARHRIAGITSNIVYLDGLPSREQP